MQLHKCFFSIIIIRIDHNVRFFHHIFTAQYRLAGSPRLLPLFRKDIEEEFKAVIGDRIAKEMEVAYVYQEISDVPCKYQMLAEQRQKPLGPIFASCL